MENIIRRHVAALPLVLGTIIALISTALVGIMVNPPQAAQAQESVAASEFQSRTSCSAAQSKFSNNETHDAGNQLGGIHIWRTELRYQECDGFDIVHGLIVKMTKSNGNCSAAFSHVNNYDFNPNAIGGWDAATRTIDCNGGQTIYNIGFTGPAGGARINSNDSQAARCVGVAVQVDKGPALGDFNGNVPAVCVNGL